MPDQPIEWADAASVDNIYRLYVNGVDVGGDDMADPRHPRGLDSPRPGANAIGLEVANDGPVSVAQ